MKEIKLDYIKKRWENLLKNIEKWEKNEDIILSFYVPFCWQKCKFCNCFVRKFNDKVFDNYYNLIKKQIEIFSPLFKNHEFDFIIIWWWSPSVLWADRLEKILKLLYENFNISKDVIGTFESDLNFTNNDILDVIKKYWMTNVSCWIQTTNEYVLEKMERFQNKEKIEKFVEMIKKYDFNLNLDVIYSLPYESFDSFKESLDYIYNLWPETMNIFKYENSKWTEFYKEWYRVNIKDNWTYSDYKEYVNKYFLDKWKITQDTIKSSWWDNDYRMITYFKNEWDLDYMDRRESMSILNFWYWEKSFIIWEMEYSIFPNDMIHNYNLVDIDNIDNLYKGNILTLKESISKYFFVRFSSFIDIIEFKDIFKVEIFDILWKEIMFLEKLKKINFDKDKWILMFDFKDVNDLILYQRLINNKFIK